MFLQKNTLRILCLLLAAIPAYAAVAQSFPTRPITLIVAASPGGAMDLVARNIAQKLTAAWGQSVIVENKSGATGIIGTDAVAKAASDGHTLVLVASSHAINASLVKKLPFDTVKSFVPIIMTHEVPLVLAVSPELPVKSLAELIAYAKKNPSKLTFASSGAGGAPHLSGELFKTMAGIDIVHIPYKSSTLALPDLLSGRTSMMFFTVPAIKAQIANGSVRALAVTTAKSVSVLPNVPTMAEAGLPGFETSTWSGILAPAGTPKATVAKLNTELNKILAMPDIRQKFQEGGLDIGGGTSQQFADFMSSEIAKWAKVASAAGIQPE